MTRRAGGRAANVRSGPVRTAFPYPLEGRGAVVQAERSHCAVIATADTHRPRLPKYLRLEVTDLGHLDPECFDKAVVTNGRVGGLGVGNGVGVDDALSRER